MDGDEEVVLGYPGEGVRGVREGGVGQTPPRKAAKDKRGKAEAQPGGQEGGARQNPARLAFSKMLTFLVHFFTRSCAALSRSSCVASASPSALPPAPPLPRRPFLPPPPACAPCDSFLKKNVLKKCTRSRSSGLRFFISFAIFFSLKSITCAEERRGGGFGAGFARAHRRAKQAEQGRAERSGVRRREKA